MWVGSSQISNKRFDHLKKVHICVPFFLYRFGGPKYFSYICYVKEITNNIKKKIKIFVDKVCNGLLELGAIKVKDQTEDFRTFELNTVVGKLIINVDTRNSQTFTVFSRFEDVESAKEKFNSNPYSGKYNLYIGANPEMTGEIASEIALEIFRLTMSK